MAAATYTGAVRRLLLVHKERGRLGAVAPLSVLLTAAVTASSPGRGPIVLVPIPSRAAARRSRGHDPVARMCAAACRLLRRERSVQVAAVLAHARPVADQSGLTRDERLDNLSGAFALRRDITAAPGDVVVVVDDVCSTGATLAAAATAVATARAGHVRAAVVAAPLLLRGPPHSPGDRSGRDRWQ
jgi:predicted amidophosphoribosyltransferase